MGRLYTVQFNAISVSAVQELFSILPASNIPCLVHALFLGQTSDVGDAQDEVLLYQIIRGHTTVGSGGASVTPVPLDPNDSSAGFTARRNDTTIASSGTPVTLLSDTFNVRAGLQLIFTPEMRPRVENAEYLVVRLPATQPADALTMSGTLFVEEL